MNDFFRIAWEQPDDSGAAIADEPLVEPDDAPEVEPQPEPEVYTFTREQLEALPHFDQFAASHDIPDALLEYGKSYGNARGLIARGAQREPLDEDAYRQAGIDPSEIPPPPEPDPEPAPGIWNAPWVEPDEWTAINELANSDQPEHRQRAAQAIVKSDAPEEYKKAYWDNAYGQGNYEALVYNQTALQAAFDQRLAEQEARWEERFSRVNSDLDTRNAADLIETAKAQVPGLVEHANGVITLWNEFSARTPGYDAWFHNAPRAEQIKEFQRLTVLAAAEAAPQRAAAQQAAQAESTSAKLRARTETSRTSGTPETEVDEGTRQRRDAMRRVGARIT